jgi:hypothetical protein
MTATLVRCARKSYREVMKEKASSVVVALLLILAVCAASRAGAQVSRQEGARLQEKFDTIAKNGASTPPKPMKTLITESELNSYLTFNLEDKIPKGLTKPQIQMLDNGQVRGRILVDMDDFKRSRQSNGVMDPLNYLSGQVPVTARGTLRTSAGKGQFQLASAELMGFPLPKPLLQELVSFFSRTRNNPRGFDIDAPFDLPAKVREMAVSQGQATLVQ